MTEPIDPEQAERAAEAEHDREMRATTAEQRSKALYVAVRAFQAALAIEGAGEVNDYLALCELLGEALDELRRRPRSVFAAQRSGAVVMVCPTSCDHAPVRWRRWMRALGIPLPRCNHCGGSATSSSVPLTGRVGLTSSCSQPGPPL